MDHSLFGTLVPHPNGVHIMEATLYIHFIATHMYICTYVYSGTSELKPPMGLAEAGLTSEIRLQDRHFWYCKRWPYTRGSLFCEVVCRWGSAVFVSV